MGDSEIQATFECQKKKKKKKKKFIPLTIVLHGSNNIQQILRSRAEKS